jgi:CheY-like chemotaxis protein
MLESRIDIATVITDIEIPGSMDGLNLAAAIRDRWPPVNVVMTSGKVRPGAAQMPRNTHFVRKPFETADLVRAFRSFGQRSRPLPLCVAQNLPNPQDCLLRICSLTSRFRRESPSVNWT